MESGMHADLTQSIIGAAIEVHRHLGPGLLESTYESCLYFELDARGFSVERQKELPVVYKEQVIECGYRIDLLVNQSVIIELKAVEQIHPIFEAQILSDLKLSDLRVGLLINFNTRRLVDGIKRFVL